MPTDLFHAPAWVALQIISQPPSWHGTLQYMDSQQIIQVLPLHLEALLRCSCCAIGRPKGKHGLLIQQLWYMETCCSRCEQRIKLPATASNEEAVASTTQLLLTGSGCGSGRNSRLPL